jgi:hypothetical protein
MVTPASNWSTSPPRQQTEDIIERNVTLGIPALLLLHNENECRNIVDEASSDDELAVPSEELSSLNRNGLAAAINTAAFGAEVVEDRDLQHEVQKQIDGQEQTDCITIDDLL